MEVGPYVWLLDIRARKLVQPSEGTVADSAGPARAMTRACFDGFDGVWNLADMKQEHCSNAGWHNNVV